MLHKVAIIALHNIFATDATFVLLRFTQYKKAEVWYPPLFRIKGFYIYSEYRWRPLVVLVLLIQARYIVELVVRNRVELVLASRVVGILKIRSVCLSVVHVVLLAALLSLISGLFITPGNFGI